MRKQKGKSRMDNPETRATLDTRHTTMTSKTKTQHKKTKKISNTDFTKERR
jgi:hypothetical protein